MRYTCHYRSLLLLLSIVEFIEGVSQFSVQGEKEKKLLCKTFGYNCMHYTNCGRLKCNFHTNQDDVGLPWWGVAMVRDPFITCSQLQYKYPY